MPTSSSRSDLAALGLGLLLGACGGKSTPPPAEPAPPTTLSGEAASDEEDDGLEVASTKGRIDPDVVQRAMAPHEATLEACYTQNVGRRRWLGGSVEVTWDVAADGTLQAVKVSRSNVGAWKIEKCVLDIARKVSLGKPIGGKPASVSREVAFSTGSDAVAWSEDDSLKAVGAKTKDLTKCAKGGAAPTNVNVTMYVGTRGKVQSVGFASPSGFADAWADCAQGKAMKWSLTDPRGAVAKASFVYNPAALPAEGED